MLDRDIAAHRHGELLFALLVYPFMTLLPSDALAIYFKKDAEGFAKVDAPIPR